ncbi:MAG: serine hydrolase [Dehalococcoidia bacterium]
MTTETSTLESKLHRIVERGPAEAGICVKHVERDEYISLNGDRRFPTCSVFKVPVLVEAFARIGAGELRLDERWTLGQDDRSMGSGILQILQPGLEPTTHDLLSLMITISDNTATDMLVRRLDPGRITATMQRLGLQSTWVDVTCRDLLANIFGPTPAGLPRHELSRLLAEGAARLDSPSYGGGHPNDVSTANEMAELFCWIATGERLTQIGIDDSARQTMLGILFRQQLNDRLPRYLPGTLAFAHKTGSISGPFEIHNDAGVLFLDVGQHVAIAAFTQAPVSQNMSPRALADLRRQMDDTIAEIGLAVYEHYH